MHRSRARDFLAVADEFRLGDLTTERPHPASRNLSRLASEDPGCAVAVLQLIDTAALTVLTARGSDLGRLAAAVDATLQDGGRVFLCGCGATGRLSLALETLWRAEHAGSTLEDRIVAFMAGGDVALIRSVERFEDYPRHGARQLEELDFGARDLLIACTEGGETPFVIGAAERAAAISARRPFLLYCNPDDQLRDTVERSRRVIDASSIDTISLPTGPMAITGSTRMQASTVLMAAVGAALRFRGEPEPRRIDWVHELVRGWRTLDLTDLAALIVREAEIYGRGEYVLYEAGARHGISVLTDTTERAPTFSLHPFENFGQEEEPPSWCYLLFPDAEDSAAAWRQLLARRPRTLEWPELGGIASRDHLLGFDFSRRLPTHRREDPDGAAHHRMRIGETAAGIRMELDGAGLELPTRRHDLLTEHLWLKMVLNIHSTLVMGRLGRYEGNVMTWVRPSNNKLVDRCIRYADHLLRRGGREHSYAEIAERLFELRESVPSDRSLVLAIVRSFDSGPGNGPVAESS